MIRKNESRLGRLGVSADDVALVRLETVGPVVAAEPIAVVWVRRWRLVRRGLGTLVLGPAITCAFAAAATLLLEGLDPLPDDFTLGAVPASPDRAHGGTSGARTPGSVSRPR